MLSSCSRIWSFTDLVLMRLSLSLVSSGVGLLSTFGSMALGACASVEAWKGLEVSFGI